MSQRISKDTILLTNAPSILASAAVVGKKEGEGPLARHFDIIYDDTTLGEGTWEKSESKMQKSAVEKALEKAKVRLNANVNFDVAMEMMLLVMKEN